MRRFLLLSRVQLQALLYALNPGGGKKRRFSGWLLLTVMGVLCLWISASYSFPIALALADSGGLDALFLLLPLMAAGAGLLFTLFAAQGVVFGGSELEFSFPLPVPLILLSKLTALYGENLFFTLLLLWPAGAAWLWQGGGGGLLFLLRLTAGGIVLALLPTALSLGAGFLLHWFTGRVGYQALLSTVLYLAVIAAGIAGSFQLNRLLTLSAGPGLSATLQAAFQGWGLPFLLFQDGVCAGNWASLALLFLLAGGALAAESWLFGRRYGVSGASAPRTRRKAELDRLSAGSSRSALLKKEAARYFSTPIYLVNTGFGLLLLLAAGVFLPLRRTAVWELLAQAGVDMAQLPLLPLAAGCVCFLLSTAAITGSSISLEGRCFWILRSAPVTARQLLGVKAAFQVLVTLPCLAVACPGLTLGLGLGWGNCLLLLVLGTCVSGGCACFGLLVNLTYPRLDAPNDMVVVKQSLSSLVSTLGAMAGVAAGAGVCWLLTFPLGTWGALWAVTALAALSALGLWLLLQRRGEALLDRI